MEEVTILQRSPNHAEYGHRTVEDLTAANTIVNTAVKRPRSKIMNGLSVDRDTLIHNHFPESASNQRHGPNNYSSEDEDEARFKSPFNARSNNRDYKNKQRGMTQRNSLNKNQSHKFFGQHHKLQGKSDNRQFDHRLITPMN